jgi:uroporphyrinogen decarboxylase
MDAMTTTVKPFLAALAGEVVRPAPVWLMRQAGRYLPEYRALRAGAPDFLRFCLDPDLTTEATLQPIRRYGFDAAILFSDILVPPFALGHGVRFEAGEGPVLDRVTGMAQVGALDLGRAREVWAPVMETVRRLRASLPPRVALIGFAGAPFTVAAYMVEGGGSRDFAAARLMALGQPELFGALMARLEAATIGYLAAQAGAGAEALMLFDTWAGILSPAQFRRWVIAPTARIAASLRERFPAVPFIGFPRGAGPMLGDFLEATRVQAVSLDTAMPVSWAVRALPAGVTGQGNVDPLALVVGGKVLEDEVSSLLRAVEGRPWVVNLGHGIVPQTPPEHVAALVEMVRSAR